MGQIQRFIRFPQPNSGQSDLVPAPKGKASKANEVGLSFNNRAIRLVAGFFVTCIACSTVGCTLVGPDHSQPLPQMLSNEFRTKNTQSRLPATDPASWWQSFADPTLNQLVQQAVTKNLTVQKAAERIIEARANVRLNGGQLAPNGNSFSGYEFTKRSPNARPFASTNGKSFSLFTNGFDSMWEIDLFGRIERSIEAAEAELSATEFSLADIQQTLVADVATSYLSIRLLQDQISVIQQSIELQQATSKLVGDRTDAGVSTKLDAEQTTAFLHRTIAAEAALKQQLDCEFNRLSILLGESPANPLRDFVGTGPIPLSPLIPDAGIPADLLRRRPDVRIAEANVAAATAKIGVAEADLYPRLSLLGTISLSSTDSSSLFQSDSLAFTAGPSVAWNILHFGRIHDNIDIQESRFRQTVADYRSSILAAVNEIEDSLAKYDGYQLQLTAFEKARQADANAVELSLARYKVGKANFQRVLDAQLQLLQDSQATAIARANATMQLVRLYKATGGGWGAPAGCVAQDCGCNQCCGCTSSADRDCCNFDSPAAYQSTPTAPALAPGSAVPTTKTTKVTRPLNVPCVMTPTANKIAVDSNSAASELYDWGIPKNETRRPLVTNSASSVGKRSTNATPNRKPAAVKPGTRRSSSDATLAMYFMENQPKQTGRSRIRQANAEIESMVWKSSPNTLQSSPTTPSK